MLRLKPTTLSPAAPRASDDVADPQGALLDAMDEGTVLDALGPSWATLTPAERVAYAYPGGRLPPSRPRRRWWEAV